MAQRRRQWDMRAAASPSWDRWACRHNASGAHGHWADASVLLSLVICVVPCSTGGPHAAFPIRLAATLPAADDAPVSCLAPPHPHAHGPQDKYHLYFLFDLMPGGDLMDVLVAEAKVIKRRVPQGTWQIGCLAPKVKMLQVRRLAGRPAKKQSAQAPACLCGCVCACSIQHCLGRGGSNYCMRVPTLPNSAPRSRGRPWKGSSMLPAQLVRATERNRAAFLEAFTAWHGMA